MDIQEIISKLNKENKLSSDITVYKPLSGGTVSELYLLQTSNGEKYALKINNPKIVQSEVLYLKSYNHVEILPDIEYVENTNKYFVYSFIEGAITYIRGNKREILESLVHELINHYKMATDFNGWGWADEPTHSWNSFLINRTEEARLIIDTYLEENDHKLVFDLMEKHKKSKISPYLLHGDLGIHNFIFANVELTGIIDPCPVIGDPLYDLIYAFCSSPDDLTIETFDAAADCLSVGVEHEILAIYENVLIGLYHRLAACKKHHPNDFDEYVKAWFYWKEILEKFN
ncbi:aminoglycoside phosphotransferase family protein [Fictibacillus phosphorivorans]|uniref:aminoglycoside phosphotransferase family protein n=1 Tax=Fictibacillus phosphorivorans TaxID=1221500 RepID=UPI00119D17A7|nr:aminoglycoside phosphotransferase family protein [Fictibacillus phosphorivorans]